MVKLSVFYPATDGFTFDKDYYLKTHIPLSLQLQGDAVKSISVEFGLNDVADVKPLYVAMCHFVYDSLDSFRETFMPHTEVLQGDIKNYTNIQTIIQFSELVINK